MSLGQRPCEGEGVADDALVEVAEFDVFDAEVVEPDELDDVKDVIDPEMLETVEEAVEDAVDELLVNIALDSELVEALPDAEVVETLLVELKVFVDDVLELEALVVLALTEAVEDTLVEAVIDPETLDDETEARIPES